MIKKNYMCSTSNMRDTADLFNIKCPEISNQKTKWRIDILEKLKN